MTAFDYHAAIRENRERLERLERKLVSIADPADSDYELTIPDHIRRKLTHLLLDLSGVYGNGEWQMEGFRVECLDWLESNAEPER